MFLRWLLANWILLCGDIHNFFENIERVLTRLCYSRNASAEIFPRRIQSRGSTARIRMFNYNNIPVRNSAWVSREISLTQEVETRPKMNIRLNNNRF
jgi:hypothetical protein